MVGYKGGDSGHWVGVGIPQMIKIWKTVLVQMDKMHPNNESYKMTGQDVTS